MQTKTLATIAATTQKEKYTYTTITNGTQRSAVQRLDGRWYIQYLWQQVEEVLF